jgi:cysteine desulfurase
MRDTKKKKIVYLDFAATTFVGPAVKKVMEPFLSSNFGNPSSLHQKGREAKKALENSRKNVAKNLNCSPDEIIFTAGGTESINLAILGLAKNFPKGHIITSKIEHEAVLEPIRYLERQKYKADFLNVDREGFVSVADLAAKIRPETFLISIMYANNEIGAIEPIGEIARCLKKINIQRMAKGRSQVYLHTDACQAAGFCELDAGRLGADLISVNGSKIYGPKQSGFLFVRKRTKLSPVIYGGGQENNLRSGTENVANAVGLSKAFEMAQKSRIKFSKRLAELRNFLIRQVSKLVKDFDINGPVKNLQARLPNNVNFTFKGVDGEALMFYLDAKGICVSTGSACGAKEPSASHVLLALGRSKEEAGSSIRITLGKGSTKADIQYAANAIANTVNFLRKNNESR